MHKNFLAAGALFAALGVALGAFGAHGLQNITADEKLIRSFQTGVQYQVYHSLALLAAGMLYDKVKTNYMQWAGRCFMAGIILFSGSLYLLALLKAKGSGGLSFIGPITPLGGLLFIAGWLLFFMAVTAKK